MSWPSVPCRSACWADLKDASEMPAMLRFINSMMKGAACMLDFLQYLTVLLWAHERCRSKWIAWLGACRISSRWLAEPHQARQLPAHYAKFTSNISQRMNEILQPEFFGYLLQNGSRDIKMEPSSNRNWQSPVVDYAPLERVYYLLQ